MTTQIPRPRISAQEARRKRPLPIYVSVDEAAFQRLPAAHW